MFSGRGSRTRIPLHLSRSVDDSQSAATVYYTDSNDVPLARLAPRHERLARLTFSLTLSQSHDSVSEGPPSTSSVVDQKFQNPILDGLNHRTADKSSVLLKDRRKGTMTREKDNFRLPSNAADIRCRIEHLERGVEQMPVLISSTVYSPSALHGLTIVRNAVVAELQDLYMIMSSLEARKFDLRSADVRAAFEWFVTFENFVRCYLTASERDLYSGAEVDTWANLQGCMALGRRKATKTRIIGLCEGVYDMKRVLLSRGRQCGQEVEMLRKRVDALSVCLARFVNEEAAQVPSQLESRLGEKRVEQLFSSLVKRMSKGPDGRDLVVLMARGVGEVEDMAKWVRGTLGGSSRSSTIGWMGRFADRHTNYARLFKDAEREYRSIYRELAELLEGKSHDGVKKAGNLQMWLKNGR